MKSLKTKVIMSAIVLVFALIATIGSTYAWFTVSSTVNVNQFTVDVASVDSLLIKVWDGEDVKVTPNNEYTDYGWTLDDFSSSVDITDGSQYDNLASVLLLPVTALKGETVTTGTPDSYATDYDDIDFTGLRVLTANAISNWSTYGRELNTANPNSTSGGYIMVKFWLLRTKDETNYNYNVTFDYDVDDNNGNTTYENAMFFGVDADSGQYIFGDNLDLDFAWADGMAGFANGPLDALATNTTLGSEATLMTESADTGNDYTAHLGTVNDTHILDLDTVNVPELVTVYIWMEGWDSDASNAVMGTTFDFSLTFTLVKTSA